MTRDRKNLKRKGIMTGKRPIADARLEIIKKKRSKVVDARDKLGEIARSTDAREKLQKIRNLKEGKVMLVIIISINFDLFAV